MRLRFITTLIAVTAVTTGCASFTAQNYSADFEAIDSMKRAGLTAASIEEFRPRDPAAKVNEIRLRGAPLVAKEGSFAAYIEQAMVSDLTEAGLYDPKSKRTIGLVLTKNDIDVRGISEGVGEIEAAVTVTHDGSQVHKSIYTATTRFESSFAGAIAVPKGQAEYPNLVRALLSKIYRDPAFIRALRQR